MIHMQIAAEFIRATHSKICTLRYRIKTSSRLQPLEHSSCLYFLWKVFTRRMANASSSKPGFEKRRLTGLGVGRLQITALNTEFPEALGTTQKPYHLDTSD